MVSDWFCNIIESNYSTVVTHLYVKAEIIAWHEEEHKRCTRCLCNYALHHCTMCTDL